VVSPGKGLRGIFLYVHTKTYQHEIESEGKTQHFVCEVGQFGVFAWPGRLYE